MSVEAVDDSTALAAVVSVPAGILHGRPGDRLLAGGVQR